jgi:hypothetical protein
MQTRGPAGAKKPSAAAICGRLLRGKTCALARAARDSAAQPCRGLTANSTQSPTSLDLAGFH